ncbi:hypothetical protein JNW90_21185 [Micromonospora sp. STR1s_5]|nr:hypothetical protein [Micromonospora sp. STR1s_5]
MMMDRSSPEALAGHDLDKSRRQIFEDVITEADAYRRYGHLLEDKELRRARQQGKLGFMRRKRTIFYRLAELEQFVQAIITQDYVPCQLKPGLSPTSVPPRTVDGRRTSADTRTPARVAISSPPGNGRAEKITAVDLLREQIAPRRRV